MGEKRLDYISIADYLAFEENSEFKHEFRDGEIVAKAGGSMSHGRVIRNTNNYLDNSTKNKNCETFNSEIKLYFEKLEEFCYPDTYVVCGDLKTSEYDKNSPTNPILVVEVLSPSTEAYDRGEKFRKYKTISTFKEYVLITPDKVCVETFYKQDEQTWIMNTYLDIEDNIQLRSIGLAISVKEIYRNVDLNAEYDLVVCESLH